MRVALGLLSLAAPAAAAHPFARESLRQQALADAYVPAAGGCPCASAALCEPIGGPPVAAREVFGFVSGATDPAAVNWTHVTTVAWGDDAMMCAAHAAGARVVAAAPSINLTALEDPAARAAWVVRAVALVEGRYVDGMTFDYESPQPYGSPAIAAYAALVAATRRALHATNPSYQVSTCVASTPDDVDGRGYPMNALADASDLLYVMDYDTRSQIFDACIASANAPLPGTVHGIGRFRDLGIPASKLVLGVPWYGYRYECLPGATLDGRYCDIESVPFRGVNCSDAAGSEVDYAKLRAVVRNASVQTSAERRDANMDAPFFNALERGAVVQYWYDDPASLRAKFSFARGAGLAGVGPFCFGMLAAGDPGEAAAMWASLDAFAAYG
ncbi:chitinase [Aureococcus anophagefferens]|uniref:Di-N-acetyl-chitobiase-like protein n=2 Tax=Aureococcus anophagefferens TaxID=44056 RepID=F0XYE2_AURAN|nr:di-N-acetyl-chitobiase-like protein [Aureococcus anophagefferens]EGB12190.1 di-N-acetyl-chitobiase-like protein [Aureococcus anophagefferens]|eukprot:XP_009033265.1 di-N-acetyl-chitobiase-like protein [Aureococcus anophagefferens]